MIKRCDGNDLVVKIEVINLIRAMNPPSMPGPSNFEKRLHSDNSMKHAYLKYFLILGEVNLRPPLAGCPGLVDWSS